METAVLPAGKKRRISSVEFWRFVFTVMVSLYHLEIFFMKKSLFPSGSGAVEFFFVLAGFLLGMGAEKRHLARGGRPSFPSSCAGWCCISWSPPGWRASRGSWISS